jgi:hypothetical protein
MLPPLDIQLFREEVIFGINNPILNNHCEKMIFIPQKARYQYGMVNYIMNIVGDVIHKSILNHTFISVIEGKYLKLTPTSDNLNPYNVYYAHIFDEVDVTVDHTVPRKTITNGQLYNHYRLITSETELSDMINMIYRYNQTCAIKLSDELKNIYDGTALIDLINTRTNNSININPYGSLYLLSYNEPDY